VPKLDLQEINKKKKIYSIVKTELYNSQFKKELFLPLRMLLTFCLIDITTYYTMGGPKCIGNTERVHLGSPIV